MKKKIILELAAEKGLTFEAEVTATFISEAIDSWRTQFWVCFYFISHHYVS